MQTIALSPRGIDIQPEELTRVAAAISQQLTSDVMHHWGVAAVVTAYPKFADAPGDAWQILVVDDAVGRGGMHSRPSHPDEPVISIVQYQEDMLWSLAASHEAIEMLVDPLGNKFMTGPSPRDGSEVDFLVEVCDPCQSLACAYPVAGAWMSDFVLPSFYRAGNLGAPYSFKKKVQTPLSIAAGGALSWRESASGDWYQLSAESGPSTIEGPLKDEDVMHSDPSSNLRGLFDRRKGSHVGFVAPKADIRKTLALRAAVSEQASADRTRRADAIDAFIVELLGKRA